MYRYLRKRNQLCSKNKLILCINGLKQLTQKRETEKKLGDRSYLLQKSRIYSGKKNYFRSWILAEVEQLFS